MIMNFKILIFALLLSCTWSQPNDDPRNDDEINPENDDDLLSSSDESNDGNPSIKSGNNDYSFIYITLKY